MNKDKSFISFCRIAVTVERKSHQDNIRKLPEGYLLAFHNNEFTERADEFMKNFHDDGRNEFLDIFFVNFLT
jgi:hypothetical protein